MVSAGPVLLLLLLMTSLVLGSLSAPPSSPRQDARSLQKRGKTGKTILTATQYSLKIGKSFSPFIGLIPVVGGYINTVIGIAEAIIGVPQQNEMMNFLKVEFKNLNLKIDKYHTRENWEHTTKIYSDCELNIKTAYKQFPPSQKGWDKKKDKEKEMNVFKKYFDDCVKSTALLHTALTSTQPSFNDGFGKNLIAFSRCSEKYIKGMAVLINELFYAGNAMSYYMYQQDGSDKADQLAEYAYDAASVMFEIHKHCISNIDTYVKLDVVELIDVEKERGKLAKNIREFLDAEFDRYDWIAVAFITKHSQHSKLGSLNKHILSKAFIREEKGEVTVAVAKQLKGTHSKAAQVIKAIEKCFKKEPQCKDVIKLLGSCEETVDKCEDAKGTQCKVKEAFTAVHAFIDKVHDSSHTVEAKEAPDEYLNPENPSNIPYIYTGKCKKYKIFPGGHFRVLIKSDEELTKAPCDRLKCGKGECVVLKNSSVPVCKCKKGFYGENCEESLKDYKNMLRGKKSQKVNKPKKG